MAYSPLLRVPLDDSKNNRYGYYNPYAQETESVAGIARSPLETSTPQVASAPIAPVLNSASETDDQIIAKGGIPDSWYKNLSKPAAPTEKGFVGKLGQALGGGVDTLMGNLKATGNVYMGDYAGVKANAKQAQEQALNRPKEQQAFGQAMAALPDNPGFIQGVKGMAGAIWEQPQGALQEFVAQAPNSAAVMGGMYAGGAAGSLLGPVGTVVGAIAGGFLGNLGIETGARLMESGADGLTPAEAQQDMSEGALKAAGVTGVDVATLGASRWLMGAPSRAASKAIMGSLTKAGVDVADDAAVATAMTTLGVGSEALLQGARAMARSTGRAPLRTLASAALETVGEGSGEYLGEVMATGQGSMKEALLESIMAAPMSAGEIVWAKSDANQPFKLGTALQRATGADLSDPQAVDNYIATNLPHFAALSLDQDQLGITTKDEAMQALGNPGAPLVQRINAVAGIAADIATRQNLPAVSEAWLAQAKTAMENGETIKVPGYTQPIPAYQQQQQANRQQEKPIVPPPAATTAPPTGPTPPPTPPGTGSGTAGLAPKPIIPNRMDEQQTTGMIPRQSPLETGKPEAPTATTAPAPAAPLGGITPDVIPAQQTDTVPTTSPFAPTPTPERPPFIPTHTTSDGVPVRQIQGNEFEDANGDIIVDDYTDKLTPQEAQGLRVELKPAPVAPTTAPARNDGETYHDWVTRTWTAAQRRPTDGAWDGSTIENTANAAIKPLAKKLDKGGWSVPDDFVPKSRFTSEQRTATARHLDELKQAGVIQLAFDNKGYGYYAKADEAVPAWLTTQPDEQVMQTLPDKPASGMQQRLAQNRANAAQTTAAATAVKTSPDIATQLQDAQNSIAARQQFAESNDGRPFSAPTRSGQGQVLVTPSAQRPGSWQVTYLDAEGQPSGDSQATTYAKAVDVAHQYGVNWDQVTLDEAAPRVDATTPRTPDPVAQNAAADLPIVDLPIENLQLSKDVPQFKQGANDKGVVEPLGGKFDRTGTAPIQVWERLDGRQEVISGRHRLDLAQRSGETSIPVQVHREADGFNQQQAVALDAKLNIRDGQGKVIDYVDYFKAHDYTPEQASAEGLVARNPGKRSYTIAAKGGDTLIAQIRAGAIPDTHAEAIANAAPGDDALQAVALDQMQKGRSPDQALATLQAVKAMAAPAEGGQQVDLFGFDDSQMQTAERMGAIAARKQREISADLQAINGANKNPKLAAKYGVNVDDPESLKAAHAQLKSDKDAWQNWATNPDLMAIVQAELGGADTAPAASTAPAATTVAPQPPTTPTAVKPPPVRGPEARAQVRLDNEIAGLQAQLTELAPTSTRRAGLQQRLDAALAQRTPPSLTLTPESEADLQAKADQEASRIAAEQQSIQQADAKRQADLEVDGFNLSSANVNPNQEDMFASPVPPPAAATAPVAPTAAPATDAVAAPINLRDYGATAHATALAQSLNDHGLGQAKIWEKSTSQGKITRVYLGKDNYLDVPEDATLNASDILRVRSSLFPAQIKKFDAGIAAFRKHLNSLADTLNTPTIDAETTSAAAPTLAKPPTVKDLEYVDLGKGRNVPAENKGLLQVRINAGDGVIAVGDIRKILGDNSGSPWQTSDGQRHMNLAKAKQHELVTQVLPKLRKDGYLAEETVVEPATTPAMVRSEPRDRKFIALTKLKGVESRGDGIYFIPEHLMTPERRRALMDEAEQAKPYLSTRVNPTGRFELKDWAEVSGKAGERGYAILDRQGRQAERSAPATAPQAETAVQPAKAETQPAKEPWQMSRDEYFHSLQANKERAYRNQEVARLDQDLSILHNLYADEIRADTTQDGIRRKIEHVNEGVMRLLDKKEIKGGDQNTFNYAKRKIGELYDRAVSKGKTLPDTVASERKAETKPARVILEMEPEDAQHNPITTAINKVNRWVNALSDADYATLDAAMDGSRQAAFPHGATLNMDPDKVLAIWQQELEKAKKVEPTDTATVTNFGEQLPPSRREQARKLSEAMTDEQLASEPLSKIWPLKDVEAITDTFAAAVAHAARAEIPSKPRSGWKLDRWVANVKMLREVASLFVDDKLTRQQFSEHLKQFPMLKEWQSKVLLLEKLDRAQWSRIGTVRELPHASTMKDGVLVTDPAVIVQIDGKSQWFRGNGKASEHLDAIKALLGDAAAEKQMQFEIRVPRDSSLTPYIIKLGDGEKRKLMTFATTAEARDALKNRYAELVQAWENVKARDNITEADLRTKENLPRTGQDWRQGKDVTTEEFQATFGFKGGEWGKWVSQGAGRKQRQDFLNQTYDALMDLASIINVPPRALSLNGTLGIAFGARGSGSASAHFESNNLVINLTKTRGAGSLAHELFHALDNYFSRQRGVPTYTGDDKIHRDNSFITHKPEPLMVRKDGKGSPVTRERLAEWRKSSGTSGYLAEDAWMVDPQHPEGVRPEVEERMVALVKALNDSPMLHRSMRLDGRKSSSDGYWSRTLERAARAFENYVILRMHEQGYSNDFLANVIPADKLNKSAGRYPYLLPEEMAPITQAFDDLFATIQTREDAAGNVAIFEDLAGYDIPTGIAEKKTVPSNQGAFDFAPAPTPTVNRSQARDNFFLRFKHVATGAFRSGLDTVTTPEEVAHLVAPLRKHAQEQFYAVVTDANGKVLDVQLHTKGGRSESMVYPEVLVPAIAAVDGGTQVWFAHNHPSGAIEVSMPDLRINNLLAEKLKAIGIHPSGHIIVGRGTQATFFTDDSGTLAQGITIKPLVRNRSIPITERQIRSQPRSQLAAITNPDQAKAFAQGLQGSNVLVLLDNKHVPVATLDMTQSEMGMLRKNEQIPRLMQAIDATNAPAALIKSRHEYSASNLMRMLTQVAGTRVIDAIIVNADGTLESKASQGTLGSGAGVWFSKTAQPATPASPTALRQAIASIMRPWANAPQFEVFTGLAEMPPAVQAAYERQRQIKLQADPNAPADYVEAFWHQGKVWINSEAVPDAATLATTLRHETLGHHGLRALFGRALVPILDRVLASQADLVAAKAKAYGLDMNKRMDALSAAEEVLAEWAQTRPTMGVIRQLVAMIRAQLRKWGVLNADSLTRDEILREYVIPARGWVERGNAKAGGLADSLVPAFEKTDPTNNDIRFALSPRQNTTLEGAWNKLNLAPEKQQTLTDQVRTLLSKNWKQAITDFKANSYEGLFDGLINIDRAEKEVGVTDFAKRGYVSTRMAAGIADILWGVLNKGAPEWRNGVLAYKRGTQGLLTTLGNLGPDMRDWLGWMAGNRANQLLAEGRENNLDQAEIDELLALATPAKAPKFLEAKAAYNALNTAMLDVAQQAGLIDPASRAKWESEWYVPFYRQLESEGEATLLGPHTSRGLSHQSSGIRALKGGAAPTADLLANILTNWTKLIDASLKNHALSQVADNLSGTRFMVDETTKWKQVLVSKPEMIQRLKDSPELVYEMADWLGLPEGDIDYVLAEIKKMTQGEMEKMWTKVAPTAKDIIRVQRNGKNFYYKVLDAGLLRSIESFGFMGFNDPLTRTARSFKRLLTTGVTSMPDFIIRNFVRDAVQAWAINKDGMQFASSAIKGIRKTYGESDAYWDLVFSGGAFQGGYVHGTDPEASAQIVRRSLGRKGLSPTQIEARERGVLATKDRIIDVLDKYWERYRSWGDKAENINRLATYEAAIAAGKSPLQAAYEAKDLMDYSLRGNYQMLMRFTDMVPFLNARIQGLGKLGRAGMADPRIVGMKVAKIAAFSVALAMLNGDDDRYKKLEDWEKDAYWHFWLGDEHFRIPKPFEIGVLAGTMPERMWNTFIAGNQENDKMWWSVKHNILGTFSFNPIPQVALPVIENVANRSFFFDRPIENMSDLGQLPFNRFDSRTSDTMRMLGSWLGASPKQLEHLTQGYLGTLGSYVMFLSDAVVRWAEGAPNKPDWTAADIPVLKSFFRGSGPARNTVYATDLFDAFKEVEMIHRTITDMRKEGRLEQAQALQTQAAAKLRQRPQLLAAKKRLDEIRRQMNIISESSLSGTMKRQRLDRLTIEKNRLSERVARQIAPAF